jgi:uncharacterized membrane protein HdeD (DUF308 family)
MEEGKRKNQDDVAKVSVLNEIFEGLVSDASELVRDLYWGVKTYLLFGLITILFGVQTLAYNMESIQEQLYVPLFVAGVMLFAGAVQVFNYIRLRKKYGRLFKIQSELKKA